MTIAVSDLKLLVEVPSGVSDGQLQVLVDGANLIVSEELGDASLSQQRQDLIAKYLAAHFFVVTYEKGGLTLRSVGQSEDRYRAVDATQVGLGATVFGQQALAFDTSGTLAALNSPTQKARFGVVSQGNWYPTQYPFPDAPGYGSDNSGVELFGE